MTDKNRYIILDQRKRINLAKYASEDTDLYTVEVELTGRIVLTPGRIVPLTVDNSKVVPLTVETPVIGPPQPPNSVNVDPNDYVIRNMGPGRAPAEWWQDQIDPQATNS